MTRRHDLHGSSRSLYLGEEGGGVLEKEEISLQPRRERRGAEKE